MEKIYAAFWHTESRRALFHKQIAHVPRVNEFVAYDSDIYKVTSVVHDFCNAAASHNVEIYLEPIWSQNDGHPQT